jgi:tRNA(Ile)-lysidine synthase
LPGYPAALAVSGGGDSVALMHLFADWAKRSKAVPPIVLIVDHGLRRESQAEAARAGQWAKDARLAVEILRWQGRKPQSNIEDEARDARYRLLGACCAAHAKHYLFTAHTREDQAETFLLRLGRGSGVDGLSGMRAIAPLPVPGFAKVQLMRPLLDMGRAELRVYLQGLGADWLEDPMNDDPRFARARIRQALPELDAAGVPARRIAEAAGHLARAREALEEVSGEFFGRHARIEDGFVLLDGAALARVHREIGLRVLCTALMRVAGAAYRPRFERLEALFDAIFRDRFTARTLMGCRIGKAPKARAEFGETTLLIVREAARRTGPNGINGNKPARNNVIISDAARNPVNPPQKGRIRSL